MVSVHVHRQVYYLSIQSSYDFHEVGVVYKNFVRNLLAIFTHILVLKKVVGESLD